MRQYLSLFSSSRADCSRKPRIGRGHENDSYSLQGSSILRQIADAGSDFVTVHKRTGEVEDCSVSAQQFHGLTSNDLLADGFMQRVHVADRPACLGAFSRVCHEAENVQIELRLRCPSSGEGTGEFFRWIELSCSVLEDDECDGGVTDSEPPGVLCVSRDITRWKEREEALIALHRSTQEQVEIGSRFLANMSHELRTPLNAIIGFSEMMKLPGIEAHNEQQVVEYATIIHDSGRHLLGVIDEILDMSQLEAGDYKASPQVFCVADLVAASVELVQSEAENKGVRFVIEECDQSLKMSADWQLAKQVLAGLLAGQIKSTPLQGNVHLTFRSDTGFIEFLTVSSIPDHESQFAVFSSGPQLQKFTELLEASLHVVTNRRNQSEVSLRVPQGLSACSGSDKVVAIDDQCDHRSSPLMKIA